MPDRRFIQAARRALVLGATRLRDIVAGASGLAAYDQYVLHLRAHHSGSIPMTRAEFFRIEQAARWEGVRRCC